ncbi:MAG: family 43 glycosylhydrolase, partial [Planctomycetaceae bacterium]|nr:family 43 glycosylhydrolase [Planctomycetaceae bacterium]
MLYRLYAVKTMMKYFFAFAWIVFFVGNLNAQEKLYSDAVRTDPPAETEYANLLTYTTGTNFRTAAVSMAVRADGETVKLPSQATLQYNDGTTKQMNVNWNTEDIAKISRPGTYTINGIINQQTYDAPFIRYRADPMVFKDPDSDYYYFTGSYPAWEAPDTGGNVGYDRVILRRSASIQGLGGTVKIAGEPAGGSTPPGPYNSNDIEEITIWNQAEAGDAFNRFIWAPEIKKINGVWCILFTSSTSTNNVWHIRPAFLVNRGDPFNPDDWNEIYRLEPLPDDPHDFNIFSLDMTYFTANVRHYVTWTHKPGNNSTLVIAECNPAAPWKLLSHVVLLHQPTYAWEWEGNGNREAHRICEAQAVIQNNGTIYMAYSGSTVDRNYSIGMITAKETDDLLDPNSWAVQRFPSLSSPDLINQVGPGHNSFTLDANGNPVIVYHARIPGERDGIGDGGLFDPGRHAFVKLRLWVRLPPRAFRFQPRNTAVLCCCVISFLAVCTRRKPILYG